MALTGFNLPSIWSLFNGTGSNNATLDASNDGAAAIYRAKGGTITHVGVPWFNRNNPPTYRVGVEGVTARAPDGTYLASGNAYVDVAAPANGATWHELGSQPTVTAGQMIAATVRYQSGTIGASNLILIAAGYTGFAAVGQSGAPYPSVLTAGTWAVPGTIGVPGIAVRYSDNTVERLACFCNVGMNAESWSNVSPTIYRGTKWTPALTCRLRGIWAMIQPASDSADFNIKVFAGSSSSPSVTLAIDADKDLPSIANKRLAYFACDTMALTAGTVYRFVYEPTTANNLNWNYPIHPDAYAMAGYFGELAGTTGTSTPTWTDYDTVGNGYRSFPIIPDIDQVDSGGGGIIRVGMNGGLVQSA